MASRGAIALWCHTVMRRVHGNTINTMARISLLFGISRVGSMPGHYLREGNKESQTLRERKYVNGRIYGNLKCQEINVQSDQNGYHHFMWSCKIIIYCL